MTTPRLRTIPSFPKFTLQRLDSLIDGYLTTLLDRTDDIKLSDFTKLVELRHRIGPEDTPTDMTQQYVERARDTELSQQAPVERRMEDRLA